MGERELSEIPVLEGFVMCDKVLLVAASGTAALQGAERGAAAKCENMTDGGRPRFWHVYSTIG